MKLLSDVPSETPKFVSNQVTAARRFYLNLKPRSSAKIAVVCGGLEECAADYVIERNTFPFWSVEFVGGGVETLTLAGKSYALCTGSIFVYGPGVPHLIRTSRDHTLVKYFVDFIGEPSQPLLRACGLKASAC